MSRYIDADKLLNPDNIIVMQDETGIDEFPYTYTHAVKVETILNAPTANVVEVRHGEWETICDATTTGGFNWYMHTCSACGYTYKTVAPIGYTYCPECGAKMDGERREE